MIKGNDQGPSACDAASAVLQNRCCDFSTVKVTKGLEVTVCDENGPRELAVVGRPGRGAFRLKGSTRWFTYEGEPAHDAPGLFVRPRLPGDEKKADPIVQRNEKYAKLRELMEKRNAIVSDYKRSAEQIERVENQMMRLASAPPIDIHEQAKKIADAAYASAVKRLTLEQKQRDDDYKRYASGVVEAKEKLEKRAADLAGICAEIVQYTKILQRPVG